MALVDSDFRRTDLTNLFTFGSRSRVFAVCAARNEFDNFIRSKEKSCLLAS